MFEPRKTGFFSWTITAGNNEENNNMKVEWAPLLVPFRRRMQTLAALGWISTLVIGGIFGWFIYAFFLYTSTLPFQIILAIYGIYIYQDWAAGETEDRRWEWVRKWSWWKHFTDYFPVKIVKTADLPPEHNYLLATFPHGVLCSGAYCAFCSDHCNFTEKFPGLKPTILTLVSHFRTPFIRELVLAMGSRRASNKCLKHIFEKEGKGNAVSLMVGGAREALYTHPGRYKIYLRHRKGFVKIALETGTALVPVISFNEPELFDQVETEGTLLRKIQDAFKSITGIAPIMFMGRGIFQYSFGIIPRRHPVFVTVGEPIYVEKVENPSEEQISKLHEIFIDKLQNLFDKEKKNYLANPNTELEIV